MVTTNPHPKGCFWYDYAEKWGAPDIKYCEETLCQFISEPANTWSNLAIVFAGIFVILFRFRQKNHHQSEDTKFIELYGLNTIFVGVTSLIYHLSNNFLTQFVDFLGMYAFFGLLLLGNLEYLGKISKDKIGGIYALSFLPFSAVFFLFRYLGIPVQLSIAVIIFAGLGTKFLMVKKLPIKFNYLFMALGVFAIAFTCQVLDINRVFCDPHNHWFQMHACWHFFNGIGMGLLFFHYRQISTCNQNS